MASNKSIDGLITRDAKSASTSFTPKSRPLRITTPESVTGIVKPKPRPKTSPSSRPTPSTPSKPAKKPTQTVPIQDDSTSLETALADIQPAPTPEPEPTSSEEKSSHEQSISDFLSPIRAFDLNEGGELTASHRSAQDTKKPTSKGSSTSASASTKHQKSKSSAKVKKKPSKARRIIAGISLFIVLGLIGVILWAVLWGNDIIAKITGGQGNVLDLFSFMDEHYDPLKTDSNGRTNILAFGTSGYNMDGDEGEGVHDGAQLTDSIMVLSLNQTTGDIAMLSLPRDLKASPTCTRTGKINEVYWCNNMSGDNEDAGATALMTEVGSILGIDFQYYAHLNWGSLVSIVDTLGGIKITLDEPIHDYYYTEAVYEPGVEYEINGEQALGLARARHGTTSGDFSRGASQQKILIGIKDKVFEKNLSLSDLLSLASTLGDNLRTNFSMNELKSLAHLTYEFDFENMRQISLLDPANGIRLMTTGSIDGISYVLPSAGVGNYGAIRDYVAEQLSNDPRVYESPTIIVLNASETAGLAATEQTKLKDDGYSKVDADNAPEGEYPTGTTIYTINNKPNTKILLEKLYNTTAKSSDDLPANVTRSYDFVIILNPETTTPQN